jgi:hypothetical protein
VIGVALAILVAGACITALVMAFLDNLDAEPVVVGAAIGVLLTLSLLHLVTVLT